MERESSAWGQGAFLYSYLYFLIIENKNIEDVFFEFIYKNFDSFQVFNVSFFGKLAVYTACADVRRIDRRTIQAYVRPFPVEAAAEEAETGVGAEILLAGLYAVRLTGLLP